MKKTKLNFFLNFLKKQIKHTKKELKWKLIAIGIALLFFIIDFVTKAIARPYLNNGIDYKIISSVLYFVVIPNPGVGFSLLSNNNFPLVVSISTIALILFLTFLIFCKRFGYALALALAFFGGIANLIDRLIYGYVLDFIDFRWLDWFGTFIFNVADIMVTIGIIILVVAILYYEIKETIKNSKDKKETKNQLNLDEDNRQQNNDLNHKKMLIEQDHILNKKVNKFTLGKQK